jgi:hypothetical protein
MAGATNAAEAPAVLLIKTLLITTTLGLAPLACAQHPIRTLPKNYSLEFENSWVRVVHVRFAGKEVSPPHDHPKTPTLYVYLADAGPLRFKHKGPEAYSLDRPAVKRGGLRLSPGNLEQHEVENLAVAPSDFLRVELKTIPLHTSSLHGRFPPADADFWSAAKPAKVLFEDGHIRITRVGVRPNEESTPQLPDEGRAIEIAIRDTKSIHAGETWSVADHPQTIKNTGEQPMEILRVELKVEPKKETQK